MIKSIVLTYLVAAGLLQAQASPQQTGAILAKSIQSGDLVQYQLREYLFRHVPKPSLPQTAEQWTAESKRIRSRLLNDVIFHGWPAEWVSGPLRFEETGMIETGKGYRMRKIRYEIVPGFWTSAIVYEPASLSGRVPAILNLSGHGNPGKAFEYKQKGCINYALRGMIALNPEWLAFGELNRNENKHDFGAHLELVGANAAGLFYLAMRKGLDYLDQNPHVDRERLAVTGLSGGGWQTIVLSALDERVKVSIPVAGYESLDVNIVHPRDTADIEQEATDFRDGQDYTHLTAMRAPRPTLVIFNAEDNCCFRAPMVKQDVYDDVRPFFRLFGKPEEFAWHENFDPGTHNYQVDNRQQSYGFLATHFGLQTSEREIPVDGEVRSAEDLTVGLPADNLTILGLARKLAAGIKRPALANGAAKEKLRSLVRYKAVTVERAQMVDSTKNKGVESRSYQLRYSNGLSVAAVWLKSMTAPENAPITVMIDDRGRKELREGAADRVNRGEQVLAIDLLFTGESKPQNPPTADYALLLASIGDRPIGMEAAQLVAATEWLGHRAQGASARIEAVGMRSQVAALIAAALAPGLFSEVAVRQGISSFGRLLSGPVLYGDAPDLFCLDLYKVFDIENIAALAAPARVSAQ